MLESSVVHPESRVRGNHQRLQFGVALLLAACSTVGTVWCQEAVEDHTLSTSDGWQIATTYYKSAMGEDAPVVVMLHMQGSNRLVWQKGLAERLHDKGYAVITVDLRHHGQSKSGSQATKSSRTKLKKDDYVKMITHDLAEVKQFILDQHQKHKLNMRKMGIIAADFSAVLALNFTAADWYRKPLNDTATTGFPTPTGQDVQALVLMSPAVSIPGAPTQKSVRSLKTLPVSILVCVGSKDSSDRGKAQRLFQQLGGDNKKSGSFKLVPPRIEREVGMYYQPYENVKLRGTDLLGRGLRTETHIMGFLDEHLKKLDIPWVWRKKHAFDTATTTPNN